MISRVINGAAPTIGGNLSAWYGYHGYEPSGTNDAYDARNQSWSWPSQFGRLWRICTAPHANTRCQAVNKDLSVSGQALDIRHSYDNVGNVTAVRDYVNANQVQSFAYDHLNRLTSAATNGVGGGQYSHTYTYNAIGNITNFAGTAYGYNGGKPHAVTHLGGVQRFWYDANGNMIKRIEGSVTYEPQTFDVQNRLVSVTKVGTGVTTFAYDAAGIRVKTVHPGGKTSYFPFPGYEEEVNGSTTTRRVAYATAGQMVALRVQVVGGSNTLYYLHSDHLGSTSLATTTAGAVVSGSAARYLPYGGFRTTPTAGLTDIGFTGHRHNNINAGAENIGLIYMQARWYLPGIGRFVSADPLIPNPSNPQSFNRYSYVENRPLSFTDPTGHCSFDPAGNIDRFDCSLDEFDAMPIDQRLRWMEQFMRQIPGTANWFNNIVGIIEGFVEYGLAAPGSWLSIVDAAILQGIQDGHAQSAGIANLYSLNPGAPLWREFFDALGGRGSYQNTLVADGHLINLWGSAEAAATNYGVAVATGRGLSPNGYEWAFLQTGNLYRWAASRFDGGLGTPGSWLGAGLGVFFGSGEAVLSLDVAPIYNYGELGMSAGYRLGAFFNDPRSLHRGHSPVYWYSTTLIWANQETHRWP